VSKRSIEQVRAEADKYAATRATFSPEMREKMFDLFGLLLDNYLYGWGEPKTYREYTAYTEAMGEGLLVKLIEFGVIQVTPEFTATEEQQREAVEQDTQRRQASEAMKALEQVFAQSGEPQASRPTGYL
jgi:hypothetical protein